MDQNNDMEKDTFLQSLLDDGFGDGEGLDAIREQLGVPRETWLRWIREGGLPEEIFRLARAAAEGHAAQVWGWLLALAKGGSIPAIRLYFDLFKDRSPSQADHTAHVPDPEVIRLRKEIFDGDVPVQ